MKNKTDIRNMGILGFMYFLSSLSYIFLSSCNNYHIEDEELQYVIGNEKMYGELIADGNDNNTYNLILSAGYNYETPDNSGKHINAPFRHILQSYDEDLKKYVFDFILHVNNDDDRGIATINDRQRNEIKTDIKSPDFMIAQKGETLKISWLFKLPCGMQTTNKFSHVHQLKGIDNSNKTADVSTPLITFTARTISDGKQQFQVIYTYPSDKNESNIYLSKINIDEFLGEWINVEEIVKFDSEGEYSLNITRLRDNKKLIEIKKVQLNLWREGSLGIRPKWGLYRNFGTDGALKYLLRDECLRFADFKVEKVK